MNIERIKNRYNFPKNELRKNFDLIYEEFFSYKHLGKEVFKLLLTELHKNGIKFLKLSFHLRTWAFYIKTKNFNSTIKKILRCLNLNNTYLSNHIKSNFLSCKNWAKLDSEFLIRTKDYSAELNNTTDIFFNFVNDAIDIMNNRVSWYFESQIINNNLHIQLTSSLEYWEINFYKDYIKKCSFNSISHYVNEDDKFILVLFDLKDKTEKLNHIINNSPGLGIEYIKQILNKEKNELQLTENMG